MPNVRSTMDTPVGHLDPMCIPIVKLAEDETPYRISSIELLDQRTRLCGAQQNTCDYHGEILCDKTSRECVVVTAMPHDDGLVARRAIRAICKHLERDEYPDETMWASG